MSIIYHEQTKEFHLYNDSISYIIKVLRNGQMGQMYFGSSIPDKEDFGYFIETAHRPMTSYLFEGDLSYSLEHLKQEYPSYGTTDYREPAFEILQENGSETCTDFWSEIYVLHGTKKATGFAIKFGRSDGILFNTGFLFYTVQSPDNYVGRLS